MRIATPYLVAGGAVAIALLWFARQGAAKAGQSIGLAAVDLADGVVSGVVYGIGDRVGLPRTDINVCQQKINAYRAAPWYEQAYLSFGLSAHCSAGDYLRFVGTGRGPLE